jgi:broad specificity phosphatase PhoE
MTTIHLVRHGETIWHAENRYTGRSDVSLTSQGERQAGRLARWAAGAGLTAVVSSDLSRAIRTAEPSATSAGLPLTVEPLLREVDFGDGEGLTSQEMLATFPSRVHAFHSHPATRPLPNAETGLQACRRALAALARLVDKTPDGTVLVVSHSTLTRLMLCWLLGLPVDEYRRILPQMNNVARTTVEIQPGWEPDVRPELAGCRPAAAALLAYNAELSA